MLQICWCRFPVVTVGLGILNNPSIFAGVHAILVFGQSESPSLTRVPNQNHCDEIKVYTHVFIYTESPHRRAAGMHTEAHRWCPPHLGIS